MTLRQLCRSTQIPSMVLYHFVAEEKTGIAPTRLVAEKDRVAVGNLVTVTWEGDRVPATILALSGKYMLHPPCLDFVNALLRFIY